MSQPKIRWGIMGAGGISQKFASDLRQSQEAELSAVVSQTKDKATSFAETFDIPHIYDDYRDFAREADVDIVYIGTLHPMHREGALLCLENGKSVLCEKSFAMNADEARDIIETAEKQGAFLMEAMWTRYLPAVIQARQWMAEGRIGDVRMLTANFGFDIGWQPSHRLLDKRLGGGALLDTGIYPVSLASMVFGEQPARIDSHACIGETGVDERFSALFEYSDGQTASLHSSIRLNLVNDAYIYGTEGMVHLPNFLGSQSASLQAFDGTSLTMQDDRDTYGYLFEAEEAMRCLREGRRESEAMPLDETLAIMQTMDRLREQWGLTYPDTVR